MPVEDVPPRAAWDALRDDPEAILVDVRTDAEWNFVGLPDLSRAGKQPVLIPWQTYPGMQVNAAFADHLQRAGLQPEQHLFFLCRSGARSQAAAAAMTAAGFDNCFNISGGFEGPLDASRHRGAAQGWKADGLPWMQS